MVKVLIADDESIILHGIRECVPWDALGMRVVAAVQNGEAALEAIERHQPALCLLDVRMPKVDGLEVARQYLASQPEGIVILITGYDEFTYAQQAVNTGVFAYILKPVDEEELVAAVRRAGERIHQAQQKSLRPAQDARTAWSTCDARQAQLLRNLLDGEIPSGAFMEKALELGLVLKTPIMVQTFRLWMGQGGTEDTGPPQLLADFVANFDEDNIYAMEMSQGVLCLLYLGYTGEPEQIFLRRLIENLLQSEASAPGASEKAYDLAELPCVYRRLNDQARAFEPPPPVIAALIAYVRRNYADSDIRLQGLAVQYNITASYLSRLFSRWMGVPFTQFLRDYRIRQSLRELGDPKNQILSIAVKNGFSSQHYFAEAFKQTAGVSPSAWRKRHAH